MKVKRLEIQGFKSFKDKTVVHFDDGVTGIVGPNGCGKSNIVDSFFWVMGEQSAKHLRGTSSGDLIFSGSEKYAAGNLAEVTMVLATGAPKESELPPGTTLRDLPPHMRYEEVAVTRRLYRSGDSEYLINGQTCRLKDIHELFMDTGAGPKAYSIIEQGQISKIVASKPEDRRVLIEEAAGITKFKARKKESLRKIEATQTNLQRINDIIIEIERQLGSLERQAGKARQFKKYKEELQHKELLVGRKKLYSLKDRIENLKKNISDLSVRDIESRSALSTTELRIETLKIQTSEAQQVADDSLTKLQAVQRELSSHQTKMELHKRSILELHNSSESLESEYETIRSRIQELEEEKASIEAESTEMRSLFENADGILKERQSVIDVARAKVEEAARALELEKRELMSGLGRQTELSNQIHGLEARVDALSVQLSQISSRIADRELDASILDEKSSQSRELHERLSSEFAEVKSEYETLKASIQSLEFEIKNLRIEEAKARQERTQAESKQKALQQLVDSHEGFRADVKKILGDEKLSQGLTGAFADSLEALPGFEFALEAALREFLESLFVNDADRACELIQTLKSDNLGRASFWSLDLLSARAEVARANAIQLPQGVTALRDVIRCNHSAEDQVAVVFQNYGVVEDLDSALRVFRENPALGLTLITKNGDSIDCYGRVSGGSTKSLEGGVLTRKSELLKLTESLKDLVINQESLSLRLENSEADLFAKKERYDVLNAQVRDLELQSKSAEKDYLSQSQQWETVKRDLDRLNQDQQQISSERAELWEKLDSIRGDLLSVESTAKGKQAGIEERTASHAREAEDLAQMQAGLVQLKVDFAAANEKYRFAREKLSSIEKELRQGKVRSEEIQRNMNRKLDEKDSFQQELLTLEETVQEYIERVQNLEETLHAQKDLLEQSRHLLNAGFDEQRQLLKSVEETSSELNRNKLDQDRGDLEFQALYQALFERYGLEESAIVYDPEFDQITPEVEKEMFQEVDRLREKIRKLGDVNVMAVEEYDEQKKRHEFLQTQRDDLLRSISDLEKAIIRINKTSEDRFARAYEEINKRFQQIFPLVFGGGWAKLELTNPADIMETGVEIMAQPPGKKVGSIQLMSGGEKALTAVALIFSIFLIKPSPFCVLDEVDAPLDDHNVGKFNMLLREMASRSQFIIITHNKRTMELNNKLYGVTMEEPGVSKMVSIQMH